ncbi:MAG TPA: hypothetical protein VMT86_20750 [Bryobacteraceae bacterium]|nr:hypothetical protein [Bryobacteraceae bacterium]
MTFTAHNSTTRPPNLIKYPIGIRVQPGQTAAYAGFAAATHEVFKSMFPPAP